MAKAPSSWQLIGDKADDADPLNAEFAAIDIQMTAPHKRNRQKAKRHSGGSGGAIRGGGKPSVYWPWRQNYRRILVRYEYHDDNYLGLVHLGCILILLRAYFCDGFQCFFGDIADKPALLYQLCEQSFEIQSLHRSCLTLGHLAATIPL